MQTHTHTLTHTHTHTHTHCFQQPETKQKYGHDYSPTALNFPAFAFKALMKKKNASKTTLALQSRLGVASTVVTEEKFKIPIGWVFFLSLQAELSQNEKCISFAFTFAGSMLLSSKMFFINDR